MDSSTRTEQPEAAIDEHTVITPAAVAPAVDASVSEPTRADVVTPAIPSMVSSIREQCSACGAAMASDQRYCLECGERRGPARVPTLDGLGQRATPAPTAARPARARMSINSTMIAGIGTLLLAMGVGVLIGRSGNSTSGKAAPAQVVTVAGGAGSAATSTPQTPSSAAAAPSTKSSGSSAAASAKAATKAAAAPPKTVKVGSAGTGPGYQKGHFTGNFFGPEAEK